MSTEDLMAKKMHVKPKSRKQSAKAQLITMAGMEDSWNDHIDSAYHAIKEGDR